MYIHIGGDHVIPLSKLIMILDYSQKGMEEKLISLIQEYEQLGKMIWISTTEIKSIVLSDEYLYASPKSSLTIKNKYSRRLNEVIKDDHRGILSGT